MRRQILLLFALLAASVHVDCQRALSSLLCMRRSVSGGCSVQCRRQKSKRQGAVVRRFCRLCEFPEGRQVFPFFPCPYNSRDSTLLWENPVKCTSLLRRNSFRPIVSIPDSACWILSGVRTYTRGWGLAVFRCRFSI
ncbi:hypothetical protein TGFOU_404960 [Toxoplasma gondii FOU]|uniref:Transmembrane protein n=1 Tax=Toxoplasma gondii FOU TaxID=943167 RepID=A0A086KSC6_TOXGO|nr:hypothetical protein TGFOU_404960 [Toxoplasma gondii FOU]